MHAVPKIKNTFLGNFRDFRGYFLKSGIFYFDPPKYQNRFGTQNKKYPGGGNIFQRSRFVKACFCYVLVFSAAGRRQPDYVIGRRLRRRRPHGFFDDVGGAAGGCKMSAAEARWLLLMMSAAGGCQIKSAAAAPWFFLMMSAAGGCQMSAVAGRWFF